MQALTGAQQWVDWHRNFAAERASFAKVMGRLLTSTLMFLFSTGSQPVPVYPEDLGVRVSVVLIMTHSTLANVPTWSSQCKGVMSY